MTYNPNIPQATDDLSDSQPQILGNFSRADTSFGTDHYPFSNLTSNNGFHKHVTWVDQTGAIPSPTSVGNQVNAYGVTTSGITMPFYQRDGLATVFALAPIKAYAQMNITSANVVTINNSFNITSAVASVSGTTVVITITNPMRTTTYGVITTVSGPAGLTAVTGAGTTTQFTVGIGGAGVTAFTGVLTVLVVEF